MPPSASTGRSRRAFLKKATLAGAGLTAAPGLILAPGEALAATPRGPVQATRSSAVRIRGRVQSGGQGVQGVGVSDGLSVVATDAEGAYELISSARRPFVYLSLPAGYQIPQNETGTARFYQPIRPDGAGAMEATFDLERSAASDENHTCLVLADPQTQNDYEVGRFLEETVPDVAEAVRGLSGGAVFGVSCGDIMFDDLSLYPRYEEGVQQMGVPFFQVIGNHDLDFDGLTDEASSETFRGHFGPTYYSFDRGAVHYVVLDDVFWNHDTYFGYLGADQLHWLAEDLARVEAGRPVVVFAHIPALSTRFRRQGEGKPQPRGSITNRAALYELLAPYEAHIVSGHTHEMEHVYEGGVQEHIRGAACGAWWSGPICYDGTPSGYSLFEARGEEIRWRYKATGESLDYQMRVYERGADPQAPDEIVANVWDWDPEWTVVWYEDGVRRGAMARRTGLDPLSIRLHAGKDQPERRPWVDPVPTDHLFYAPAPTADAGTIRIEAVDRWGNTFSAAPRPVEAWANAGAR